jgi:hypothetical protein
MKQPYMKTRYLQAYRALKLLGVPVFTNEDHAKHGNFGINAEDSASATWCDYYGSPYDWDFGVNPAIDSLLTQFGLMAEWVNPSLLGVYEA